MSSKLIRFAASNENGKKVPGLTFLPNHLRKTHGDQSKKIQNLIQCREYIGTRQELPSD